MSYRYAEQKSRPDGTSSIKRWNVYSVMKAKAPEFKRIERCGDSSCLGYILLRYRDLIVHLYSDCSVLEKMNCSIKYEQNPLYDA